MSTISIPLFDNQVTLELFTYRTGKREFLADTLSKLFKVAHPTAFDSYCEVWAEFLVYTDSAKFNWKPETNEGFRMLEKVFELYKTGIHNTHPEKLFDACLDVDTKVVTGWAVNGSNRVMGINAVVSLATTPVTPLETRPESQLSETEKQDPN